MFSRYESHATQATNQQRRNYMPFSGRKSDRGMRYANLYRKGEYIFTQMDHTISTTLKTENPERRKMYGAAFTIDFQQKSEKHTNGTPNEED